MYVKECPNCKEIFRAKDRKQVCCSRACSNQYAGVKAQMRLSTEPIEEIDGDEYACKYNPRGCTCYERNCDSCGWNPKVAQERLEQIRRKMMEVPV